jgi:hypothetical protein
MTRNRTSIRSALAAIAVLTLAMGAASAASASPFDPSGVIRIPKAAARLGADQSTNWFGYSQGTLENGGNLFTSISATWSVPVARQHTRGRSENSATWIGIGGGCIDSGCGLKDPSGLIQAGTEQDVAASGKASYSAWWELVPVPAVTISHMTIKPRDRMLASILEVTPGSELWRITLEDVTRRETFTTTTLYPSSRTTAEWIEETPLSIGTSGTGFTKLPALSPAAFDNATVNGHPAVLKRSEQIRLADSSGVIAAPSAPDAQGDGFGACSWATGCRVPRS